MFQGTVSKDKNERLFSEFGINYNNEPEQFKRGSVAIRHTVVEVKQAAGPAPGGDDTVPPASLGRSTEKRRSVVEVSHCGECLPTTTQFALIDADMIADRFWAEHADVFPVEHRIRRAQAADAD